MSTVEVLFWLLSVLAIGSGVLVVTTDHLVHAALWLVVTLGSLAGCYLLLTAEFVAWVQVLIYVGAVVVLLLFAVMLTRAPIGPSPDLDRPAGPAALIGAGVGFGLSALLIDAFRWTRFELPPPAHDVLGEPSKEETTAARKAAGPGAATPAKTNVRRAAPTTAERPPRPARKPGEPDAGSTPSPQGGDSGTPPPEPPK